PSDFTRRLVFTGPIWGSWLSAMRASASVMAASFTEARHAMEASEKTSRFVNFFPCHHGVNDSFSRRPVRGIVKAIPA
ncbi:hypothetical protein N9027_01050, partial [bacterium]|nr:hypothetical protein [bacterium]